ncbi:MAG: hypothetical protein WCF67_09780, partial [Chitinophagaceae bacterium]
LYTTRGLDAKIINNEHDLFVAVHTPQGNLISNAIVFLDDKRLSYNDRSHSYGPVKHKKVHEIKVEHNSVLYTFPIETQKFGGYHTSWLKKLTYAFPLKYLFNPGRIKRSYGYARFYHGATIYECGFQSYLVFNKPVYKPGDTVHLKAFVQTAKGKPVNRPLLVRICDNYFVTDTILVTIKPYRPGGYEYEFVVNDSLDLTLDDEYLITLEELNSRKYDLDEYDGDLDEDEYAAKRKVVARGKFKHEDYELSSISFNARSIKKEHARGEEMAIFLKATDENELAVMDGRVEIVVRTAQQGNKQFHARKVFLPDTLWTHSQPLETIGETKIILPDSIFPRASFNYVIECSFLNTNNELQDQTLSQHFTDEPGAISFEVQNDSLKIDHTVSGKSVPVAATLSILKGKDSMEQRRIITIPATIKINPFATTYEVETDSLYETYELSRSSGMVSCLASRTKDSVAVQLVNPNHLPVWYTIFAGDKIIHRGYVDSLVFLERSRTPKNYFVSLQYIYHDQVYKENFTIPFRDKLINIRTEQPAFVYPGQTVNFGIHLTDAYGKPVSNADVTAFSFTKKFDAPTPYVPYLGRFYPQRIRKSDMSVSDKDKQDYAGKLNWERWSREMSLDTIEYYNFLHPKGIYMNQEAAPDSMTQLAPFVTYKGDLQPVHFLYIDEIPVFFSQSQHMQRYSFKLSPGLHTMRLRTRDYMIKVDSFRVTAGVKTFMSIEADSSNRYIRIEKMPDTLTAYERQLWSRYMILVQNNFGENLSYIQQHENVFLLNEKNTASRPLILTGPYLDHWTKLVVKNKYEQVFEPEGSWQFLIQPGLIKQRQLLNTAVFSSALPAISTAYNFRDYVLTAKEVDSLWQDYLDIRSSNTVLFQDHINRYGNAKLLIGLSKEFRKQNPFIKNIILFRYDNADYIKIYTGSTRDLGYLDPGMYRIMFLMKKNNYFIKDSIAVLQNGVNYYETEAMKEMLRDSVSIKIAEVIEGRSRFERSGYGDPDLEKIKETFNDKFLDPSTFPQT